MSRFLPDADLPSSWRARWIEPVESGTTDLQRPAHHLAADIDVRGGITLGILRTTAHGVYEAFVNGERVGDIELTPGFTAYRKRLQVHAFDVTDLL
ncbi:MAG: alpha-L-rhamnosidase N-terminal domain-containing protein, partial [Actinomycetota bacterium]